MSACPEAHSKWFCLNGATCFTVKVRESILYNCWCSTGFYGLRCEYKYARLRQNHVDENKNETNDPNKSIEFKENDNESLHDLEEFMTANHTDLHTFSSLNGHKDIKQATLIVYNLALLIILVSIIVLIVYRFIKSRERINQSYNIPLDFNLNTMASSRMSNNANQVTQITTEQRSDNTNGPCPSIESVILNKGSNLLNNYIDQKVNYASESSESLEYNSDANIDYLHYQESCLGNSGSRWIRHFPINHDS